MSHETSRVRSQPSLPSSPRTSSPHPHSSPRSRSHSHSPHSRSSSLSPFGSQSRSQSRLLHSIPPRIPTPISRTPSPVPPHPPHIAQREEEEESSGSELRVPRAGPSRQLAPPALPQPRPRAIPQASSLPRPPTVPQPQLSSARTGPSTQPAVRRITHMPERFTEIRAQEQEAEAARRSQEQDLLQSQRLKVERVYIHVWKEVSATVSSRVSMSFTNIPLPHFLRTA